MALPPERPPERGALGDPAALFHARYEPMLRLAVLLTGSRAVAEDLVQDCFVRLIESWDRVEQPAAYLRTSVVNACRDHGRRATRERARLSALVPVGASPETEVVADCLDGLPERQRAALLLRYFADWSEPEIAAALGCRGTTVRTLVRRGLLQLREVLS